LEEREGARRGCQILLLAARPRGDGGCDALVQLLLGHTKIESTVRYLGVEVDDALEIAEKVDV
jgi:hypothetical protein